jgi:hypothetical protein
MNFKIGDRIRIFDTPELKGEVLEVLADDCRVCLDVDGKPKILLIDKGLLEKVPKAVSSR